MVDESPDPTLAGGIDNMLLVNLEEVTDALILLPFPRVVLNLSLVSNTLPNNFTNVLYDLKCFGADSMRMLMNMFYRKGKGMMIIFEELPRSHAV